MKTFQKIVRSLLQYEPDDLITLTMACKIADVYKDYYAQKEKHGYLKPAVKGGRGRGKNEKKYFQKDLLILHTIEWRKKNALKRRRRIKEGRLDEPLSEYRFKTQCKKMWPIWRGRKDDDLIDAYETFKKLGWIQERLASRFYYDILTSTYKQYEYDSIPNQYKRNLNFFENEGYKIYQNEFKEFMIRVGDLKDYLKKFDLRVAASDIKYEKRWLECDYGKAWIKHKSIMRGGHISKELLNEYGAKRPPSFNAFDNAEAAK